METKDLEQTAPTNQEAGVSLPEEQSAPAPAADEGDYMQKAIDEKLSADAAEAEEKRLLVEGYDALKVINADLSRQASEKDQTISDLRGDVDTLKAEIAALKSVPAATGVSSRPLDFDAAVKTVVGVLPLVADKNLAKSFYEFGYNDGAGI